MRLKWISVGLSTDRRHDVCFMYVSMCQRAPAPPFTLPQALTPELASQSVLTQLSVEQLRNIQVLFNSTCSESGSVPRCCPCIVSHGALLRGSTHSNRKAEQIKTLFMSPLVYFRQNIQVAHVRSEKPLPPLCVVLLLIFFSLLRSLASVPPKLCPPDGTPGRTAGRGAPEEARHLI